jgi:hypothetical protein
MNRARNNLALSFGNLFPETCERSTYHSILDSTFSRLNCPLMNLT